MFARTPAVNPSLRIKSKVDVCIIESNAENERCRSVGYLLGASSFLGFPSDPACCQWHAIAMLISSVLISAGSACVYIVLMSGIVSGI
jgi:hypothetical protein